MYYIFRKPEPLGTELKTASCSVTGYLVFLEIQQGKEGMKSSRYHLTLGAIAACTKIFMEETKGLGKMAVKVSTRHFYLFGSLFSLKKAAEVAASIGVDLIGVVKTNIKVFFKATVEG